MKTSRYLTHFSFFSIFLLFGFWVGQRIGDSSKHTAQTVEPLSTRAVPSSLPHNGESFTPVSELEEVPPVPEIPPTDIIPKRPEKEARQLPVDQRNLLVIGVDDLSALDPRLESIWLIIYRPEAPHFMFVPIYPTPQTRAGEPASENINLLKLFKLDDEKALHEEFLEALEEIDFLWTDYIILDKIALSDVIEFLGGAGDETGSDGATIVAGIPPAEIEPQESLQQQARLVQDLCLKVTNLTLDDSWRLSMLYDLIPNHALTSFDTDDIDMVWQSQLMQIRSVKCEFPSLEGTSTHP